MRVTLLGTGGAWPIPRPGCACAQCAEARASSRFVRTRSALYLELPGEGVVVDAGPDLFWQFERSELSPRVDRVLITHTHTDHVLGLDDLVHLRLPSEEPLRVYASEFHQERIARIFPHLVRWGEERIRFEDWRADTRLEREGLVLEGFETGHRDDFATTAVLFHIEHGGTTRRIAFATDMGELPEESREKLHGVDLLVGDGTYLGAAGYGHPGSDAVIALAADLEVARLVFAHIGHVRVSDDELRRRLGSDAGLAYDGDDLLALLP